MRILIITFIYLSLISNLFSQSITAYSELEQKSFQVELPDSLFVVFGERIEGTNNTYIDQLELSTGFDLLLLNKPSTCIKYFDTQDGMTAEKRIDLESVTEVFFGEDFNQDFSLRDDKEIYRVISKNVQTKFGQVEIFQIKIIKLIFLNIYGKRISAEDYYYNKFFLEVLIKITRN
jgi:hypothetical protein